MKFIELYKKYAQRRLCDFIVSKLSIKDFDRHFRMAINYFIFMFLKRKEICNHSAPHTTTINWSLSIKAPFILFALRLFLSTLHEIEGIETHQRWQHFAAENIRIIFPL